MATIVLSSIGASVGGAVGKAGAAIGMAVGAYLGRSVDSKFSSKPKINISDSKIHNVLIQNSSYGIAINKVFGEARIAGNVIWSDKIKEHVHHHSSSIRSGKGGGRSSSVSTTSYSYTLNLAIAVCAGEIDNILDIWADSLLLEQGDFNLKIYTGSEDQMPDDLIESYMGAGKTPAYRGLAYVVFEDFPLAKFGNRIPNFSFHVKRQSKGHDQNVESMIEAINIIPGSGEFVYDPKLQYHSRNYKSYNNQKIQAGKNQVINLNNYNQKADAALSLDQLVQTCPNLKWASPVVCWFADSLNAAKCKVLPGIESRDRETYPDEWNVGKYSRSSARQITLGSNNRPIYGGTTSDQSVLRYIRSLKDSGLKVMFYPMLMIDKMDKPWRGRLQCAPEDIEGFFNKPKGYNQFILHYANLLKGEVDAFLIGSEFVALTSVIDNSNSGFPTVRELVKLAEKVKKILGPDVLVSYAADWTEYHQANNSWYNMDDLWASDAIDFVGIDAYFPLTDNESNPTLNEIIEGWRAGEWYDYKYKNARLDKQFLPQSKAYKNIEWWWNNYHVNPDRKKSAWIPKSKKIWFTEYGFPSVDCCTNQPNVFFDNESIDGGVPNKSKGKVDFIAQRQAIKATEIAWKNSEFVENKFLWTWDARPYPYWPRFSNLWADSYKWSRGHWVNGKFGVTELSDLISEICQSCGIEKERIAFENINEIVEGYYIDDAKTALEVIEDLKAAYFFDIVEAENKIKFVNYNSTTPIKIDKNEFVVKDGVKLTRSCDSRLISTLKLIFIDKYDNFHSSVVQEFDDRQFETRDELVIKTNVICSRDQAREIAFLSIKNFNKTKNEYHFSLSQKYKFLQAGKIIVIMHNDKKCILKIKSIFLNDNQTISVTANEHLDNVRTCLQVQNDYSSPGVREVLLKPDYEHKILDIPSFDDKNVIHLAVWSKNTEFYPVAVYSSLDDEDYRFTAAINHEARIGYLIDDIKITQPNILDLENKVRVSMLSGHLESISYDNMLSGKNTIYINGEILQFMNARLLESNLYELSVFIRGARFTEGNILSHKSGSLVVLLDSRISKLRAPKEVINKNLYYKLVRDNEDIFASATYKKCVNNDLSGYPSVVNLQARFENNDLYLINWTTRCKEDFFWDHSALPMVATPVLLTIYENDHKIIEEVINENKYFLKITQNNKYSIEVTSLSTAGRFGFSRKLLL